MDVFYPVSIITDHKLTGKHPAVSSQLQDAPHHACTSASMMSSMETRSDQCDDDQGVVASHSHADEQGLSCLIYYKERARFARSLLAPVSKHIAYFTHINLAYMASSK